MKWWKYDQLCPLDPHILHSKYLTKLFGESSWTITLIDKELQIFKISSTFEVDSISYIVLRQQHCYIALLDNLLIC